MTIYDGVGYSTAAAGPVTGDKPYVLASANEKTVWSEEATSFDPADVLGDDYKTLLGVASEDPNITVHRQRRRSNLIMVFFGVLPVVFFGLFVHSVAIHARAPSSLESRLVQTSHSLDVSSCPGYKLSGLKKSKHGLKAQLSLAGAACNAFGQDIQDLTIQVTYETSSRYVCSKKFEASLNTRTTYRLHVNIYDTSKTQFTVPEFIIPSSSLTKSASAYASNSDLAFNYNADPFAFWITRRSDPNETPLFDTRTSSLPATPIPAVVPGDNSTVLDGFQLVFENQYLQVCFSVLNNAEVY